MEEKVDLVKMVGMGTMVNKHKMGYLVEKLMIKINIINIKHGLRLMLK
jgi:hypothetical protein